MIQKHGKFLYVITVCLLFAAGGIAYSRGDHDHGGGGSGHDSNAHETFDGPNFTEHCVLDAVPRDTREYGQMIAQLTACKDQVYRRYVTRPPVAETPARVTVLKQPHYKTPTYAAVRPYRAPAPIAQYQPQHPVPPAEVNPIVRFFHLATN